MSPSPPSAPTVLYLVNQVTATSVPLQVAEVNDDGRARLKIVAWYGTEGRNEDGTICLGAERAFDRGALRRLGRLLEELEPEIIHVHHTVSAALASLVARFRARRPLRIVKTEHREHTASHLGQRALNLVTYARADAIVCNSEQTARSFGCCARWIGGKKRRVIHNGVNLDLVDAAADAPAPDFLPPPQDRAFLIASVGRYIPEKDQKTLIEAMALLRQEAFTPRLLLVGGGPLEKELRELVDRLALGDCVELLGTRPREEVYRLLHHLDLFAITSVSEGFCNALVEAMAAGCQVLAARAGAVPEVLGGTGTLVEPGDPQELAAAIRRLARLTHEERTKDIAASRQRARHHFPLEATARAYGDLYVELASELAPRVVKETTQA